MAGKLKRCGARTNGLQERVSRDYAFDAASKHTPQVLSPGLL